MSEFEFRNRHGRVVSAEMTEEVEAPQPEAVAIPKVRRQRKKIRIRKKYLGIGFIVLIVLTLIPLAIGEYSRVSYTKEVSEAKRSVSESLNKAASYNTSVRSENLKASVSELVAVRDNMCEGGFLDNIASYYPRSKQALADCSEFRSHVTSTSEAVTGAAAQLEYLEQLQFVLEPALKPLEDRFAVLASQSENWQNIVTSLEKLTPPSSFYASHNELLTNSKAIRDNWIEIVAAANTYDSAGFTSSRAKFEQNYQKFRQTADLFISNISMSQKNVVDSVKSLDLNL